MPSIHFTHSFQLKLKWCWCWADRAGQLTCLNFFEKPPDQSCICNSSPCIPHFLCHQSDCRVWHSWKFWYEWMSEYIHTNFFDTNKCPNKYSYWNLHKYSNIFKYSSRFYTLTRSPTNVRIYSYKQIWPERMSEYIRKRKIDTNECPNIYSWPIYSNIRIFEYIRHTLA